MGKPNDRLDNIGVEYQHVSHIREKFDDVIGKGANYICSGLVPKSATDESIETGAPAHHSLFWKDTDLKTQEWTLGVVPTLPNPPELENEDPVVRQRALKTLNKQMDYCHHLGISAVMFELGQPSYHLAQLIKSRLQRPSGNFTFYVKVKYGSTNGTDYDWDNDEIDTWKMFNTFRKLCGVEGKLLAVLQLNADIPKNADKLDRWKGEMVNAISIPLSTFETNESGFPVLKRSHQSVLIKFFALGVHVILEVDPSKENLDMEPYIKYIRYLYKGEAAMQVPAVPEPPKSSIYDFRPYVEGYENRLNFPMEPLKYNLTYQTYASFERDPVKYVLYRNAISLAMRKLLPTKEQRLATELVVVVAGAGRGPLVTMALEAAKIEEIRVRMYCLEKNPSAQVRLQFLNETEWKGEVTVVGTDMRYWKAPEKADIIVSELLGSFGCNELSPECLDGAQRFLKDDGIIIPQEYTSSIAPVMSHAMIIEASKQRECEAPHDSCFETPYVSYITRKYDIARTKDLFKFKHPNPLSTERFSNDRYKTLQFDVRQDCDCNGFVGYFDSILFRSDDGSNEVRMSIHPDTFSSGMGSWFPWFIPLKTVISLKKGDKLVVMFWRKSTTTKVWFEWTVVSPTPLPIHNVNGRSAFYGLDLDPTAQAQQHLAN